jgi:polyhydroxybutyrate depolymerase
VTPLCLVGCRASTSTELSFIETTSTAVAASTTDDVAASTTVEPTTTVAPTTSIAGEPDCVGLQDVESGERTIASDSGTRTYRLAMPDGYDGTVAAPMIVDFHGFGATAEKYDTNTSMSDRATELGFIVVTPDAVNAPSQWNVRADPDRPDDFSFAHALVGELSKVLCVLPEHIVAVGHSNGAVFASYLVCSSPFEFAAVAMVSATTPEVCPDDVQPAIMSIAGTADTTNPYLFDDGTGALDSLSSWAEHNGCSDEPVAIDLTDGVEQLRHTDCAGGAVVLITVQEGTNAWPGGDIAAGAVGNSKAGRTFDATGAVLDFLTAVTADG